TFRQHDVVIVDLAGEHDLSDDFFTFFEFDIIGEQDSSYDTATVDCRLDDGQLHAGSARCTVVYRHGGVLAFELALECQHDTIAGGRAAANFYIAAVHVAEGQQRLKDGIVVGVVVNSVRCLVVHGDGVVTARS